MNTASTLIVLLLAASSADRASTADGYVGVIYARNMIDITSEVSGKVAKVDVATGDLVQAGQRMLLLEAPELEEQAARTGALLRSSRAEVQKSQAELDEVTRLLDRRATTTEVFSREEMESLETKKTVLTSEVEIAKSELAQQTASLREVERKKSALMVKAPFDGKVAASYLQPGEHVGAGASLIRVLGTDQLWIRFAVPSAESNWLATGVTIRAIVADTSAALDAEIKHISPEVDAAAGVIIAEALVTKRTTQVNLGATVRVRRISMGSEATSPSPPR